ncbi:MULTISPECIES: AtuA-related protein [Aquibaculum]|uniref:AtuA-like ferredoxin-fold domain-containing protein n=1 Tax=Aquibaculum arenosum TaxID=3032591 RepID=A0ABT5YNQ1_9PROT|nr:hypothetical protein [Fodinicurvata sp. CAU 1616]MDF2096598.1 hypothetical protein [Fodinicurvata sp. CAU 1616]
MRVPVRAIAHSRSGDKGNTCNITVIAYEQDFYEVLKEQVTEEALKAHYAGVITGKVTRYAVDRLGVLNFVCEGALGGGVSRSLCLDNYGKSLASRILSLEVEVPERFANRLRRGQAA